MDLLSNYDAGSDDETPAAKEPVVEKKKTYNVPMKKFALTVASAPGVMDDLKVGMCYTDPQTKELIHNPKANEMWKPLAGPFNPYAESTLGAEQGIVANAVTGFVEKTEFNEHVFAEQYHTFMRHGFARAPDSGKLVGDVDAIAQLKGRSVYAMPSAKKTDEQKDLRKKRKEISGNVQDVDSYMGPWGTYYYAEKEEMPEPTEEQVEWNKMQEAKKKKVANEEDDEEEEAEESSEFHGKELYDFQGKSYIHPPSGTKELTEPTKAYIPKKQLHTWNGHKKGVSAIQFFPKFGHLLLSSSMDSTVKLWNVNGDRKCVRTFYGHTEAVRGIDFNHDGTRFISISYDRYIKYWDTETGQCISKHTSKKIPYCAKIQPNPARCNEFLVGQSDKKVVQWDTNSNSIVQKYDEHLGPVNSIVFVDHNRKFFSTSDDKKVFCWEYGIPVVSKYIAEPDMHSMPYTALHPNGQWWIGQSQDNKILIYGAVRKVSLNTKKKFTGHLTAGYACQLGFSPDGRMVYSGDAEGRMFFWDWKTSKLYKKMKCHDQVTIGCQWHPMESSKFATCSWDGTIKYWD